MSKNINIVIVDVDVEFQNIMKRTHGRGYVTLEYYFDADEQVFSELANANILYSDDAGDESVLDTLGRLTPFAGISSGQASLARQEIDAGTDGHSRKIRDVIAEAGDVGRILRVCHTQNLLRSDPKTHALKMFCRSFYMDPVTLEQTPAAQPPAETSFEIANIRPDRKQLFDFLAMRKTFHQTAGENTTFSVQVLDPARDYDTNTVRTIAGGLTFDDAVRQGVEWVKASVGSGHLGLDRDVLTVTGKETGTKASRRYAGSVVYRSRMASQTLTSAGDDQTTVTLGGKALPVRKSQPLVVFKVVPSVKGLRYRLSESDMVRYWMHMLDEAMEDKTGNGAAEDAIRARIQAAADDVVGAAIDRYVKRHREAGRFAEYLGDYILDDRGFAEDALADGVETEEELAAYADRCMDSYVDSFCDSHAEDFDEDGYWDEEKEQERIHDENYSDWRDE